MTARCVITREPSLTGRTLCPPARRLAPVLFRTQYKAFRKNGLTYTDVFCGAGGSSIGLAEAGYELMLAANHWPRAIETHSSNFPGAEHICEDVNRYDMRLLPKTDVLWISPLCTELSPSGRGSRLTRKQRAQLERDGHVSQEGLERTRATFYDVIRAAEVHRYSAVIVENVPEAADWALFGWWLSGMVALGYNYQLVSVSSAHVGAEDNDPASQWRDRLLIVFTLLGIPLPDVEPRPAAWCPRCEAQVQSVQSWKRDGGARPLAGKYGQQYVYRCSRCTAVAEPYVLPCSAILDWDDLGEPVGGRARPLVPRTIERIEYGRQLAAITPAPEPPAFGQLRAPGGRTITRGRPALQPSGIHSGSCPERFGIIVPYRNRSLPTTTRQPLHTIATRDSAGLLTPARTLGGCRYRMLKVREDLRAQRFPDSYAVTGNHGEQVMQAGNAVSCNVAHWAGQRVAEALCGPGW